MAESKIIDRNSKLAPAEDYNFLRREGIRLIEDLSGKIWTDYNTHDPGITLLEAICYALTDLGYRTSFDIKDILATKDIAPEKWKHIFYTAKEVLPCNPITLVDYRKIIIDIEGVRNAWIEISDDYEMLLYLQPVANDGNWEGQKYNLTYDSKKGDDVLRLRGLYKVFVEYESDIIYNNEEEAVAEKIKNKLNAHRNLCEDFISVTSIEYELFKIEAVIQVSEGADIERINARIYEVINNFFSPPITFYTLEQMVEKGYSAEDIFEGPLLKHGFIDSKELESSERYNQIHLSDIISLVSGIEGVIAVKKFSFPPETSSTFSDFAQWMIDVKDSQKAPRLDIDNSSITFIRSGDRHRNAAEKQPNKERVKAIFLFLQSAKLKSKLKGGARDFPVPAGEFMNIAEYYPFQKNLPSVYGMTESYLDNDIDEISIKRVIDELLDEKAGVLLRQILQSLLIQNPHDSLVKKVVHDLINGQPANETFVSHLFDSLFSEKSIEAQIKHLLDELLIERTGESAAQVVSVLLQKHRKNPVGISGRSKAISLVSREIAQVPLLPEMTEKDITELRNAYKKYQVERLDSKKKSALQLRGFLMIFEQIMSDYLSELAGIKELFSFDPDKKETYSSRSLQDIPDMEMLFIDYNRYKNTRWENTEMEETFIRRRNKILDHLIGRFSEDFSKYSFYLQSKMGNRAGKKLIEDKTRFLADYVQISNYRGKGFDYSNPELVRNHDNVEGMKKRICALLGIRLYGKEFIASDAVRIEKIQADDKVERYVVVLSDPDNKEHVLLRSEEYEFESEAYEILNYLLVVGTDQKMYEKEERKDRWSYQLKRPTQEGDFEIVADLEFKRKEEFEAAFEKTIQTLKSFSEDENFYVVEHILLRPKIPQREKINKKSNNPLNNDMVDLLSITEVFDETANVSKQANAGYKFKILNIKDQGKKDRIVWRLTLMKDNAEALLINEDFIFYKHLTRRIEQIRQFASDNANYVADQNADGYFTFSIKNRDRTLAVSKKNYRVKEDMEKEIDALITYFSFDQGIIADKDENYDDLSYLADPYSLQVSIIIPDWPAKFRDPTFKHLFEKTVFMETPAHIYPHLYWVDHRQMREFEEAHNLWIDELAHSEIPAADVVNNLVFQLNELRK